MYCKKLPSSRHWKKVLSTHRLLQSKLNWDSCRCASGRALSLPRTEFCTGQRQNTCLTLPATIFFGLFLAEQGAGCWLNDCMCPVKHLQCLTDAQVAHMMYQAVKQNMLYMQQTHICQEAQEAGVQARHLNLAAVEGEEEVSSVKEA